VAAPFARAAPKGARWWLLRRAGRMAEPAFATFRDWIEGMAAQPAK
jgi:hypothetical protein